MSKQDLFDLSGKVALITGASRGLGVMLASRLAKEGYNLCLVARNTAVLEEITTYLLSVSNKKILTIPCDLADHKAVESLIIKVQNLIIYYLKL